MYCSFITSFVSIIADTYPGTLLLWQRTCDMVDRDINSSRVTFFPGQCYCFTNLDTYREQQHNVKCCVKAFGFIQVAIQEKHWCKASKGVQARNTASEDELVDICWQDILINFSMVNWFLPELYIIYECVDERHFSLWTLVGMLEIRILLVFSQELEILSILTIISKI
jgi:hypothetical protein